MRGKSPGPALVALLLSTLIPVQPATAVVNQVDGQVVPILATSNCPGAMDRCLQTGINYGEGINPPSSGTAQVNAILDANTGPETFLVPQITSGQYNTVTFKLLQEGASYENIFGWYNVGSPTQRYPAILSCAYSSQGTYEPPAYDSSSPPKLAGGYTATVNFQSEYAAGRYKGGQIGFYLVTPEGTGKSCATDPYDQGTLASGGSPIDDDSSGSAADDTAGYGRVYFTESKLNNDGNYVHYLIYKSQAVLETYYFGFEDLFRGGDNDYDDTFVQVKGLVPTCQPAQEVCNAKDDNCNSQIDENLTQTCYTGTSGTAGVGECKSGKQTCTSGVWGTCQGEVTPKTEYCDGKDNDCDSIVDNNLGTPASCTVAGCTGTMKCVQGKLACDAPKPTSEICNGKDDNCNSQTDENLTRICSSACGYGTETCKYTSGTPDSSVNWTGCTAPTPTTESCDGVDNDCNGKVDDNVPGEGLPCDHSSGKTCVKGKTKCVGGTITCVGATTGTTEICDCKDNDCDKLIDEDEPCGKGTGYKCIDCACRIKCASQEFGCPKDYACKNGYCVPDKCASVTCKTGEKCVAGQCISLCAGLTCPKGQVCQYGFCVDDSCYGKGCSAGEVCYKSRCIPHPCNHVTCNKDEFCENGTCKPSCGVLRCGEQGWCRYGRCEKDPCAGVSCAAGVSCRDGVCDEACGSSSCSTDVQDQRVCRDGKCVDGPCTLVRCYNGETCQDGQCISANTYRGSQTKIVGAGGGLSCTMTARGPGMCPLSLLFVLLLLAIAARRRDP